MSRPIRRQAVNLSTNRLVRFCKVSSLHAGAWVCQLETPTDDRASMVVFRVERVTAPQQGHRDNQAVTGAEVIWPYGPIRVFALTYL